MTKKEKKLLNNERTEILYQWDQWFEIPLIILGLCWLILIIVELTTGLSPLLANLSFTIWIIFILDFIIRFSLAPLKIKYLKHNWLTIISLVAPAFRVFRVFSLLKATRSFHLLKIFSSIRRSMQILGIMFGRHGFGYIITLTFIIILLGSAGMYAFENKFVNYGDALWWTSMLITTMGSDFWPQTAEGRILCLGLAIYAFAIFGYITANVASYFIEKDKKNYNETQKILDAIEELKSEIKTLKQK